MVKLIFNADDFGYSKGINYGIMEAFRNGVLTSTTLMVTMPGVHHAVEIMKENKELAVGLHFNISLDRPITNNKSLVDKAGYFIKPDTFLQMEKDYEEDELREELHAQYELFTKLTKRKPTHIDSHLFSSDKIPVMRKLCAEIAQQYHIPMRNYDFDYCKKVKFIQHRSYNAPPDLSYVITNIDEILKYDYVEIMTHPGYVDYYVMNKSSYNIQRAEELEFLTSQQIKNLLYEKKVELINYQDVVIA